jgi:hypothetical protein
MDCGLVSSLDVTNFRMLSELGVGALAAGATVRLRCSPAVTESLNLCGVRQLTGVVQNGDSHDSPGSIR